MGFGSLSVCGSCFSVLGSSGRQGAALGHGTCALFMLCLPGMTAFEIAVEIESRNLENPNPV